MAAETTSAPWTTLAPARRNNYFAGKALDVSHMVLEQDYGRHADALHQRLSLGTGVLCGLGVSVLEGLVQVDAGVAVDGWGRTIVLPGRVRLDPWGDQSQPPCCLGRPALERRIPQDVTLYLCFRECESDPRAVALSTCTPPECAHDTIVETWCLDVRPGLPPPRPSTAEICEALLSPTGIDGGDASRAERRRRLCEAVAASCSPPQDPCVPLATMRLTPNGIVDLRVCEARARLYSNATLFEMILCLAERVDHCCSGGFRVASARVLTEDGTAVDAPSTPNPTVTLPPGRRAAAIDVRFDKAPDSATVKPQASGVPDAEWSFRIERLDPAGAVLVPARVSLDGTGMTATVKPLRRGLVPGSYRLTVTGIEAGARKPIALPDGTILDGEPTGFPSGDGNAGGDFILLIEVREDEVQSPFKVTGVAVLGPQGALAQAPSTPNPKVTLPFTSVVERLSFTLDGPVDPATVTPTTPADPPASASVLVEQIDAAGGRHPVPGFAMLAGPSEIVFGFSAPPPIRKPGRYQATLFGDVGAGRPAVSRSGDGQRLDGEPLGLPSGDNTEGGDFVFELELVPVEDTLRAIGAQLLNPNGSRAAQLPQDMGPIDARVVDELMRMQVVFNDPVDPATIEPRNLNVPEPEWTVFIDEVSDPANPRRWPAEAKVLPDGRTAELTMRQTLQRGVYRATVSGAPAGRRRPITRLSDASPLDGEPGAALPSGDGAPGGDFTFMIRVR